MKKIIKEFKEFINRGNVVDLAVGVIIGASFSKIVTSLVSDILMPIIGIVIGGYDFSKLSITYMNSTINYGLFIQNIIDFLINAFCIFVFIKLFNILKTKLKLEEKDKKVEHNKSESILEEIRDILKDKNKS